jgi:hypothetical protein
MFNNQFTLEENHEILPGIIQKTRWNNNYKTNRKQISSLWKSVFVIGKEVKNEEKK